VSSDRVQSGKQRRARLTGRGMMTRYSWPLEILHWRAAKTHIHVSNTASGKPYRPHIKCEKIIQPPLWHGRLSIYNIQAEVEPGRGRLNSPSTIFS